MKSALPASFLLKRGSLCDDCHNIFVREDICRILKSGLKLTKRVQSRNVRAYKERCILCKWLNCYNDYSFGLFEDWLEALPLPRFNEIHITLQGDISSQDAIFVSRPDFMLWGKFRRISTMCSSHLRLCSHRGECFWENFFVLTLESVFTNLTRNIEDPAASEVTLRPPNTNLSCDETYAMIRQWLAECDNDHGEVCQFNLQELRKSPSHLINVYPSDRSPDIVVLERITASSSNANYAALSYVWGPSQNNVTTAQNYAAYLKGIDIASLAKTIQDAIWVTRKLSVQYLWVDSLCIIQDSDSDKLHEIGRMDSIYGFAYVTIVACNTSTCDESFLASTSGDPDNELNISELPFGSKGRVQLLAVESDSSPCFESKGRVIDKRAWTFQEQFMSQRMLLFTRYQLLWVCSKTNGQDGGWIVKESQDISRRKIRTPDQADWMKICAEYSGRALSDPLDKLPALSSIASYFSLLNEDRYAAGLWQSQLNEQLCWYTSSSMASRRPEQWRAPSWSWASVEGVIEFEYIQKNPPIIRLPAVFSIVDCHTHLLSPETPFGQVTSGFLKVRGRLLFPTVRLLPEDGIIDPTPAGKTLWFAGGWGAYFDVALSDTQGRPATVLTTQGSEPSDIGAYCLLVSARLFDKSRVDRGLQRSKPGQFITGQIEGIRKKDLHSIFALVLRRLPSGYFHRIGCFRAYKRRRIPSAWAWFKAFGAVKEATITIV